SSSCLVCKVSATDIQRIPGLEAGSAGSVDEICIRRGGLAAKGAAAVRAVRRWGRYSQTRGNSRPRQDKPAPCPRRLAGDSGAAIIRFYDTRPPHPSSPVAGEFAKGPRWLYQPGGIG